MWTVEPVVDDCTKFITHYFMTYFCAFISSIVYTVVYLPLAINHSGTLQT